MMHREAEPGVVYLAGAGPGAADLLTLRVHALLQTADVILPDDLVTDDILALASPTAQVVPVGKRCGQPRITQAGIHELMIHYAGLGQSVLRLKSGDPLIFGRASEEMEALRGAGIRFEVVPGVTAACAVAATLETPLTNRASASKLVFATAHHAAGKLSSVDWEGALPKHSTLVIYMPGRDFEGLAESLMAAGLAGETTVAAVSKASTPEQTVTVVRLDGLRGAKMGDAPMLLLVGAAIAVG
jgi:uroporphyrin-III C-methyltransferase